MDKLGVDYIKSSRRLFGSCPIHGGDNSGAWSLYPGGEEVRGTWFCRTHNCHRTWKKTLVGFVHAMLSNENTERKLSWVHAVDWMVNFLGYKSCKEIKPPSKEVLERQQFSRANKRLNIGLHHNVSTTWTQKQYRSMFDIPSQYYLDRDYSKDTLIKYDVGFGVKTNRSVVPVYNKEHTKIVGMTARTHWDKCKDCGLYHNPESVCPTSIGGKINASKWKNSPDFESSCYLYNLWFAKQHIKESGSIIIVEGPGDVWRLEEAGINNSVAVFGTGITEEQLTLIDRCWAMNVIIMMDNDRAGLEAASELKTMLSRTHRLYFPRFLSNDVGELNTDAITKDVAPTLREIENFNKQVGHK